MRRERSSRIKLLTSPVRNKTSNGAGFTLVEVLLTIFIIGILAAITLPRLGARDFIAQLRLRTVAHQVASDIRYTRRLAITNSANYSIQFNFGNNTYDICDEGWTSIGRDFPKDVPSEIALSGTDTLFTFQRLGDPTTGGSVTLTSGANLFDIVIEPITGAVIIE